ncbi:MAG: ABC-2 type transporter [candidate division TM6 bacterium GW2011_GWF2_43_17]|nr:MAG: ABC-2 type transporter [candidate division TM6 bacterium GW2011_GWF2_43_17]
MKWHRIWAVAYRLLIQYNKDFNKLASIFYWPVLDIIVFGFMITSISQPTENNGLLINIALWPLVNRGSLTLSLALFEELRSQNLANLLTTPLTIYEWIAGSILEGALSSLAVLGVCSGILWGLFHVNVLEAGLLIIPVCIFGFLTGVAISFLTTAILIAWGTRFQTIIWMAGWGFGLISGIFYPIENLPGFLQSAAQLFPLHYLFSNIREFVSTQQFTLFNLLIGILGSIGYFLCCGALFLLAYKYSRKQGLNHLV